MQASPIDAKPTPRAQESHAERLRTYVERVDGQLVQLRGKITSVVRHDGLRSNATQAIEAFSTALARSVAQLGSSPNAAADAALASDVERAIKTLHSLSTAVDEGRSRSVNDAARELNELTKTLGRVKPLGTVSTYSIPTRMGQLKFDIAYTLADAVGAAPLMRTVGAFKPTVVIRPERVRKEIDFSGWDPSTAKTGAAHIIVSNGAGAVLDAFIAKAVAEHAKAGTPILSADHPSLLSLQTPILERPANSTVVAAVSASGAQLPFSHYPQMTSVDAVTFSHALARKLGSTKDVYIVSAITNALEHYTRADAPALNVRLEAPIRVDASATQEWLTSTQAAIDAQAAKAHTGKIADLINPALIKGTVYPLATGWDAAIGRSPAVSFMRSVINATTQKAELPPFWPSTTSPEVSMSAHGKSGAPSLVTAEEQAEYERWNGVLATKYKDLAFMLRDPEQFLVDMRARFDAQKAITPADPYAFDFSELGMSGVKTMHEELVKRLPALRERASKARGKAAERLETGVRFYEDLEKDFSAVLTQGSVSYRRIHELAYFYSRAVGPFDVEQLTRFQMAMLRVDRGQQGFVELDVASEYAAYKQNAFTVFQSDTYINGFRRVEPWFDKQFFHPDGLQFVSIPSAVYLGRDIFHRLGWYPIHITGIASDGPIAADGFLRPGGDFWMHDMRHSSIINSEIVEYIENNRVSPEQLEKLRKTSDIWYRDMKAAMGAIKDPELKRAVRLTYFNLHHEQGFVVAPSSYDATRRGLYLSKILSKLMDISGQAKDTNGGTISIGKVEQAFEWLLDFWRPRYNEEVAILGHDPVFSPKRLTAKAE